MRAAVVAAALVAGLVPAAAASAQTATPSPDAAQPTAEQVRAALGSAPPRAALIYDPREQRVIWGLRADVRMPVASLIKMVTAIAAAERLQPEDEITISARAARTPHDRLQWREGATFTANEVMHGMLMESSNGAAVAIAEAAAGSVPAFAELAGGKLASMGLEDTALVDPSGLDASGQYSTVHDLAMVAAALLENEWLASIVSTRSFELPWPDGGRATFGNINHYFERDPTAVGVKNGFTSAAGNTVAAAATRQGRTHIVIALNSAKVYDAAKRLMDVAFEVAPPTAADRARAAAEANSLRIREAGSTPVAAEATDTRIAGPAVAASEPGGAKGTLRLVLFAVFLPYAGFVFGQRRQQHRQARRARRRPARTVVPPAEAEIFEYPLIEWIPAFEPSEELPERWPERSWQ